MAQNPLLPHSKLRELHALMRRCRAAEQQAKKRTRGSREALLAATSIHLLRGDILIASSDDATALQLAPAPLKRSLHEMEPLPQDLPRLPVAAGIAAGLQRAGGDSAVLAYIQAASPERDWGTSLTWAQRARVPLIVACADVPSNKLKPASPSSFDQPSVTRVCARLKLPLITVDGEDGVAVYRVMQESLIRARGGGGPAIIWASLSSPAAKLSGAQQPLARLEAYLAARKISLPR